MRKTSGYVAAIDFGTSNSAVCLVSDGRSVLVPIEDGQYSIPTAVFYNSEQRTTVFGRRALSQYREGIEGRLMRSLKSLLGSQLLRETTLINGQSVSYRQIIGDFLAHLKAVGESHASCRLKRLELGRPVHFVDDDEERDRLAEATLMEIAQEIGFASVNFQYEPIAAALDLETSLSKEELALVVDIGGGTSDFSLVRLSPLRADKPDRTSDVLASSGIHVAGTNFDQKLSISSVMPILGYGAMGVDDRPVPASMYFDLATWHKINFMYTSKELARAEDLKFFIKDAGMHDKLMAVLRGRHGHRIATQVENAKISVAEGGRSDIHLPFIEEDLTIPISEDTLLTAISSLLDRITRSALDCVTRAGMSAQQVTILYFTGGSTGIKQLRHHLQTVFPQSRVVIGDKFSSVVRGLGVSALARMRS